MIVIGIALSIGFIIAGIWMIINPIVFWKWDHMFSVKNGEPTEIAIILLRIRGILFIVLGIVAIYALIKVR